MRKTMTIYFDAVNNTHHTIVADVSEGLPGEGEIGSHKVIQSHTGPNLLGDTPNMWLRVAAHYVGAENVKVYTITEVKPNG